MDSIIGLLPKILAATNNAPQVVETAAFVAWRRVAGEGLRGNAVPFRLFGKTLIVAVPDVAWRQQLEEISGEYLFKINSLLRQPAVTYIEFRIDPETVAAERKRLNIVQFDQAEHEARAMKAAAGLQKAAAAIKDPNLRRKFLLAAGASLDRQKNG